MSICPQSNTQDIEHAVRLSPPNCLRETRTSTGVDLFKFFFAVCIVALHTSAIDFLPESINYFIIRLVFRTAVPYFFVASGFFLGQKLNKTTVDDYSNIIRAYYLRLLKPLVFFELISMIYYGFTYLQAGSSLRNCIFLLGQAAVFYPKGSLWYVQACIIGVLLLYPFLRRKKLKLALVFGVFLYGFALLANNYSFLIVNTPLEPIIKTYLRYCISARNGLFTGFLSIAIGILCGNLYPIVNKKRFLNILLVLVSFGLYVVEVLIIRFFNKTPLDDASLYISHLFFIPVLFLVTLQLKIPIAQKTSVTLRNLSTGIYFLHRPILYVVSYFISTGWLAFAIVLFTALAICLIVYKTKPPLLYSLLK